MSKKIMLLALTAISAVMFALPAVASATWELDPSVNNNTAFSGTAPEGKLAAGGEPSITCEGPNHVTGSYTTKTTGTISLDFTNCHIVVLGFTIKCKTTGAPLENTIASSGEFHNVTITGGKLGILVTPVATTVRCGSTKPITVEGSVIGEVTTEKACGAAQSSATISFTSTAGSQTHKTTDGSSTEYDLTAQTEGGNKVTASEEATGKVEWGETVTPTCS